MIKYKANLRNNQYKCKVINLKIQRYNKYIKDHSLAIKKI